MALWFSKKAGYWGEKQRRRKRIKMKGKSWNSERGSWRQENQKRRSSHCGWTEQRIKGKEKKDRRANFSALTSLSQSSPGLYFTLLFQPLTQTHLDALRWLGSGGPLTQSRGERRDKNWQRIFVSDLFFLFLLDPLCEKIASLQHTDTTAHSIPPTLPNSHLPSRNVTYGCDNEPKILLFKWANPRSLSFYTDRQPCLASDGKTLLSPKFFFLNFQWRHVLMLLPCNCKKKKKST